MRKSKIYKIAGGFVIGAIVVGAIGYSQLSNRHKAIVKTEFLFRTGIVKNKWDIDKEPSEYRMISPTFLIDGIYKSMEGPKATNFVQLSQDTSLVWLTGFKVKALDSKMTTQLSNDFICHTNIDFNDSRYYTGFGLLNRVGVQYPRMTSLSNGQESFEFPKGYGIPMRGNDLLTVTTESLNHNIKDADLWIKHEIDIDYQKNGDGLKPLMTRTIFVALPFDEKDPYKEPLDPAANSCIPVETKNHTYDDGKGGKLSGHWVIPPGKSTWHSSIDGQLQMKDSLRLHAAAVHVHPFSTSLTVFDLTDNKVIFKSEMTNYKDKIGLEKVTAFSSEQGIWLYANHHYELRQECDNTTAIDQDMMGSMFLFFYDAELESKIRQKP
ncbi:hypothetical protein [Flavobacterium silvaticum]|uniref:Uncharacterized protein n=1 Tax=Flavobacterium silvaticum TaxID=1852020 RepID=A0A972JFI5_9FLAO|nr:hypothetical protein [Flavobacterium silvaticum]NMH28004.1 hypothetical protein [Flavobacterium silvaticum]